MKKFEHKLILIFVVVFSFFRDDDILVAIAALGFLKPSRIQEALLPDLLSNPPKNIWVTANHGTGKTLAYCIAILNRLDTSKNYTQALCIVPSYEAALQVKQFMNRLYIYKGVRVGLAVRTDTCKILRTKQ